MAPLKKSLSDYLKDSKSKTSKGDDTIRDKALQSFFGGSDIFSTFIRSKFKSKKQPGEKNTGSGDNESSTISQDSSVFLKIIAKNSIALPGMARDVNVLRQNVVKLVKLKVDDKKGAATKADKFFKTEDQREAELEASRKKQDTKVNLIQDKTTGYKNKKPGIPKEDDDGGILKYIFDKAKSIAELLFFGIIAAVGTAITLGSDIASWVEENFKPMEWIDSLFKSITEGWKAITETDVVKETLITGIGKLLEFISGGLFGEKELRENLKSLSDDLQPIITFFTEMFDRVANWMSENIGWDKFTIPLSKYGFDMPLPDTLVASAKALGIDMPSSLSVSFPDITIPGFRPFAGRKAKSTGGTDSTSSTPASPAKTGGNMTAEQIAALEADPYALKNSPIKDTETPSTTTNTGPSKELNTVQTKQEALTILSRVDAKPDRNSSTGFSKNDGTPIEESTLRSNLATQGFDADKVISLAKSTSGSQTPTATPESPMVANMNVNLPDAGGAGGAGGGGGAGSGGGGAGEISASSSTPGMGGASSSGSPTQELAGPNPSNSGLGKLSSDVAEGQRLDSAPDLGTVINASSQNNSKGSIGQDSTQMSSAYNTDFFENYLTPNAT